MKKRYELQFIDVDKWCGVDSDGHTLDEMVSACKFANAILPDTYRVVQKLGRKVIKVIYPKGK